MSKFDFLSGNTDIDSFIAKQDKYKSLKRSELDNVPRKEIVLAVTCWIEGKFSEDWSDMAKVINGLPTPCLNLYCADYVTKEIMNGGFAQAFFNTSRDFIGAGAEGFRAIGYEKADGIIERALKINFDSGKATGHSIEDFFALSENSDYDELDKEFYETFDDEKFAAMAYDYIMKYKKYFGDEN